MSESMHEPVSWLTLERYALDELPPAERARVRERLAQSSEDRACLAAILSDRTELPALPPLTSARLPGRPLHTEQKRRRWLMTSSVLGVAAALTLMFARRDTVPPSRRQLSQGTKGGELSLLVYGERTGAAATRFGQGERFKLLVTCPSWLAGQLRVAVFQAGQRYEPLAPAPAFTCGNHVPWPGAFTLDGSAPADVCLSFSESAAGFEHAQRPDDLEPNVVCVRLQPR